MAERWLTYQQLGDLLGMSAEAARQRAARLKWRKQPGNDGKALVLVPDIEAAAIRPRPKLVQTPDQTPVQSPEQTGDDKVLADAVAAFREVEERLRGERDKALAEAATERGRTAQAEREREDARIRAAAAEAEVRVLREAVEREIKQRDAEFASWNSGGPVRRAVRAFFNRRGRL